MQNRMAPGESWRFAILSDTHLGGSSERAVHNRSVSASVPAALRILGKELRQAGARFLIHCGDLIDAGTPDQVRPAAALLAGLPCPAYLALGNHDAINADLRADWARALPDCFRDGAPYYTFTSGGLRFVVLHPWWRDRGGEAHPWWDRGPCVWTLPAEQLAWLEATLAADKSTPTLLVHHAQIIPLAARRLPPDTDNHTPPPGAPEPLREILRAHPQVIGVLSGHTHAHQMERAFALAHVGTGALVEYPCEYRLVTVTPDRLVITTHALPDFDGAARSLGAGHPWPGGQAQDRAAVIAVR